MKAILLEQPGHPSSLKVGEAAVPVPGAGEIRVRIHAAGLNPADYKLMAGGLPGWSYPFIPGLDAAGVVDAVGEGVTSWKTGDRVYYHSDLSKPGTFAEYGVTLAHTAAALPDSVSFIDAAAIPCAGLTAYQALNRKFRLQSGQTLLVHAGAGGVGGFAIQYAVSVGARVIATASAANHDYLRSLGAEEVIDYTSESVHDRVMHWTGGLGVDAILNSVNRQTAQADLDMLAFGGHLACIAGAPEQVADYKPSTKTFSLHKMMLGGAYLSGNRAAEEDLGRMAEEFIQWFAQHNPRPLVSETISMEDIPQALIKLSERHVRGKIVAQLAEPSDK